MALHNQSKHLLTTYPTALGNQVDKQTFTTGRLDAAPAGKPSTGVAGFVAPRHQPTRFPEDYVSVPLDHSRPAGTTSRRVNLGFATKEAPFIKGSE